MLFRSALTWDGQDMSVTGNYLNDLGISEDDEIYSKIKARDIQDLYKNINWDFSSTISDGTTDAEGTDELWIPSVAEIYSLVGGGDISTITGTWSTEIKNNLEFYDSTNSGKLYWFRSPFTNSWAVYVFNANTPGAVSVDKDYKIRPMFLLEV